MVFVALWTQHRPIHLPFSFSTVAAYMVNKVVYTEYVNVHFFSVFLSVYVLEVLKTLLSVQCNSWHWTDIKSLECLSVCVCVCVRKTFRPR